MKKKALAALTGFVVLAAAATAMAWPSESLRVDWVNAEGNGIYSIFLNPIGKAVVGQASDNSPMVYGEGDGIEFDDANGVINAVLPTPTQSNDSRSLNSCFQVSADHDATVSYSVSIAATLSVTTGEKGTVYLETYTDSGCSADTLVLAQNSNANTGTLGLGLNITQEVTNTLAGRVPAGRYVKLRTVNDTGSPTFTFKSGVKEVF